MPRRLGLSWKLALSFLGVFVVTLAAILFALERATTESFRDYLAHNQTMSDMMGAVPQDMASMMGPNEQQFLDRLRWSLVLAGGVGAVAAGLTAFLTGRYITRRLWVMADSAGAIAAGDFTRRVPDSSADELGELANAFNRMAGSLASQEEARRRLAADIAHELRTPLAVLQGEIEALQDGVVESTSERFDSLHEQTELLTRLVDDLHTLSLADSGQLQLQVRQHDLRETARRAMAAVAGQAQRKGVELQLGRQDRPASVTADGDRIDQVLRNLLSNALRQTSAGGQITVATRTNGRRAIVDVADTGTGIATEDLSRVFDRFYRADTSRSRATGGSGLGLAIARELVRAHGGDISVRSSVGKGTTFCFWLPLSSPSPADAATQAPGR